jgi:hypothetical protein
MAFRKPERELSVTEILNLSLRFYSAKFDVLLVPFLFTSLLNSLVSYVLLRFVPFLELPQNITEEFFTWLLNYLVAIIPVIAASTIIGLIITTMANGIVVKLSSEMFEGKPATINVGLKSVLSSLSTLLITGLVVSVLTVLGLFIFVIPGIIMAIMFSLTVQVIMIERLGVSACLWRSRKLVTNRWLKTLAILFSVLLLTTITNITGTIMGNSVAYINIGMSIVIESVVSSLVQPIQPIALTFLYYSLRTREKPTEQVAPPQITVPFRQPAPSPYPRMPPLFQPKFCYKCGGGLPADAIFCPRCGVRVRSG